jgi:methionine biosynthesis protein MetW
MNAQPAAFSSGVRPRSAEKRERHLQIIAEWIEPGCRVLDLGCGRGALLELLAQTKGVSGLGVDQDFEKILGCARRGVTAYQGDMEAFMRQFPAKFFDWVICSRTVQELQHPGVALEEALRVGRRLTIGFVNYGYWRNRLWLLRHGRRVRNEVYPTSWDEGRPANHLSIAEFEDFCAARQIRIRRKLYLAGDWETPRQRFANLLGGYALYELEK